MPTSPSANMGLVMPIVSSPGTDPGPTYAATVNTALLTTVDLHDHSPGKGVKVPTAGMNINADLTFGGFSLLNGNNINGVNGNFTNLGATTLTGAIAGGGQNITGLAAVTCASLTASGAVSGATVVASGTNSITLAGKSTGTDPTITVAGDATRNLLINVPTASGSVIAGLGVVPTTGGDAFIGSLGSGAYGAAWLGVAPGSLATSNYALASNASQTNVNAGASGPLNLTLAGTIQVALTNTALSLSQNIPIQMGVAATALTLKGNAAATGSTGAIVLSNQTQQTTGVTLSVQNPFGTAIATVDFAGSFVSASGKFGAITTAGNVGLTLTGNAAAAGTACQIIANTDVLGTGYILGLQSGSLQFAVSGRGHLIPLSTVPNTPASAVFNGGYTATAAVTNISVNGSDAAFQLKFKANGIPTSINAGSVLVTITLAQAYQSTSVVGMACYGAAAGLSDTVGLAVVQNAVGTIQIINTQTFTPVSGTSYVFNVFTMGAGATS